MKKPVSTRLHGIFDYCFGIILMLPWVVHFHETDSGTWILAMTGLLMVILSLFTNYEGGLVRLIPMKLHLFVDLLLGLFLVALPFVYPMYHYAFYWPVFMGILELLLIVLTRVKPFVTTKRDLNITLPS